MKNSHVLLLGLITALNPIVSALAGTIGISHTAPDSTSPGPYMVASGEYHLPAAKDPDVLADRMTELWAKVFYPKNLQDLNKLPLVVMLHGNHGTCGEGSNPRIDNNCSYTTSGTCPAGYTPTPNHEGYNYLAENLASWGYIVVSVNANRGITCGYGVYGDSGLNLARGRLVLKHLSMLYKWSNSGDAPLSLGLGDRGLLGKIDFNSVGLFGHSRGGEGVRAAYNQYLDKNSEWPAKIPDLKIKAIFEIGAVDGQTSRVLDANGTVWNQLLPMCDGDVSTLEGRFPFERMLLNQSEPTDAQKSLYEVWGANHNFFNTEWQTSDSYQCLTDIKIFDVKQSGSKEQQKVALASVPAFFRSHLGNEKTDPFYNQSFNPLDYVPELVSKITRIDRDFTPSPAASEIKIVDDFNNETGINTSGNKNTAGLIQIAHKNILPGETPQRVAEISWKIPGPKTFFEAVFATSEKGDDISSYTTLDFRVARKANSALDENSNFGILLEDKDGKLSQELWVKDYAPISNPANENPILQTVRIPLRDFKGIELTNIRGIRFVFDKTLSDTLYFANIRLQKQLGFGDVIDTNKQLFHSQYFPTMQMKSLKQIKPEIVPMSLNSLRVQEATKKNVLQAGVATVEIVVSSQVPFPAMDSLPTLKVGEKTFTLSRYANPNLKEMVFTLSAEDYKKLSANSDVVLINGKIWQFGKLTKAIHKN